MATFDKMTRARTQLVISRPFYGTLALRMKIIEDPTCRTAWTDGKTLGYNPKFINKLSLQEVIGLVAHECMHPAFLHHTRKKWRHHFKWNIACDLAINPILKDDGLTLPSDALLDPKFAGMSAEEIYSKLPEVQESDYNHGEDPGGCGEVRPNGGNDKETTAESEREWKQALAQAAHTARLAGKLPAGMERFIDGILYTGTPWRELLRQFVSEKSTDDYTWLKCNRRHVSHGLWLPSAYSEHVGPVVVAIDTSGSIGDKELAVFGSEFNTIIEDVRPSVTHRVFCDAAVARTDEYKADDDIPWKKLGNIGGGGTDFRPVFDWVEAQGIEPKCLIYLTDMYGQFPEQEPPYPVMWASISKKIEAPFGQVLEIDDARIE